MDSERVIKILNKLTEDECTDHDCLGAVCKFCYSKYDYEWTPTGPNLVCHHDSDCAYVEAQAVIKELEMEQLQSQFEDE